MPKFQRVALFMDYENFHSTLQKRTSTLRHQYGFSPHLDFRQLVDFIEAHYGPLARRDFIAVANFTHYDRQKGGLNQVATLINVDSFEPRTVRRRKQKTAGGRKYVIPNYADMRLAYEVGRHVQYSPADLYILASGDKAFVAVAQALHEAGYPLYFLLADPDPLERMRERCSHAHWPADLTHGYVLWEDWRNTVGCLAAYLLATAAGEPILTAQETLDFIRAAVDQAGASLNSAQQKALVRYLVAYKVLARTKHECLYRVNPQHRILQEARNLIKVKYSG